jgi:hypothetical protein
MDKERRAFRLQEQGGPLDLDNTYTIGNSFQPSRVLKRTFLDKAYWAGDALMLRKVSTDET